MKAVYIEAHGGTEVLTYGDRPDPEVKAGEVKIKVRATALNRLDLYTREGGRGLEKEFPPPLILGGDCAGEVAECADDVAGLKVGDRVVVNPRLSCMQCAPCLAGQDDLCRRSRFLGSAIDGSYAEYIAVPAANAHVIADSVSFEQAAAAPTTYLPVWNMLVRRLQLKPWQTVLVLSASAGVGTAAIQMAKDVIGAKVIATTSSAEKAAKATELGADVVINYTDEDIRERVREITGGAGVDCVVDHVGADFFGPAFASLRTGGRYGICGATTGLRTELHLGLLFSQQKEIYGAFMGTKEDMREIVEMLNRGEVKPVVDRTFPLAEAAAAHEAMEATSFFGKLILTQD
ncbi:MAG: zinc-binding dehydrogenase [SAR202 cluster bacterium]|nr:zinc-binding dehydrogenase [SAR202 cluster bacterium]MQG33192.1 zinc-binding dehydrogenase [SAR202 cluster bacterium]HAA95180.1 alcohol dehydrogenase [Dehalococcoidia bacterium]HCP22750.1 alcohol dehydrogenase [Dehalococcoidia bacterium]|tara:strand:+ start:599 stop:1639 length:1041 start_codon:yes stop_codon:yes gene_type:complete